MNLTYSAKALMRADKKTAAGICPIYYFIRVGPYMAKIPSGKSIDPKEWDKKNSCPKKTTKQGQLLSVYLNQKVCGFDTFMLTQQTLGKPVTITIAISYFKENSEITLFKFWEDQMAQWEYKYAPATLKSYASVLRILKEFNPKLNFGDVTPAMIDQFDRYLSEVRHNALNGRFVKHKCTKSILNEAIRKGYIKDNPYKSFKIRSSVVNRKYLTIDEVRGLMTLEIPADVPILYRVKDIFLFSCLTGLRYSDVMSVKVENIRLDKGQPRLEFKVTKTKRELMIPLSIDALRLIQIYTPITSKNQDQLVFPKIDNPTINRRLKDLMALAGIDRSISFHCARHTFASNLVQIGTSIVYIKDLLGHKKLDQTMVYAKANKSDLFAPMAKLNSMYE
jgi:integrase/recombinase XerD